MNAAPHNTEEQLQPTSPRNGLLELLLRGCIAIIMLSMVTVTMVDVMGRYIFSIPLYGGYEMIRVLTGLAIFTALPLATRHEAHVNISMLDFLFHGYGRKIRRIIILSLGAMIIAGIAFQLWDQGKRISHTGQVLGVLEIPLGTVAFAFSLFAVLTVVVYVLMVVEALRTPVVRSSPAVMSTEVAQ